MVVPVHSVSLTRRLFLEKSVKGTTALAFSGIFVFAPHQGKGADQSPQFIDLPSPQFSAWTPAGKLLVTYIEKDGSYGLLRQGREAEESLISVGTAAGQFNWPQGIAISGSIAYIVDSNNGRVQRLDLGSHRFLEPFGGLGKKTGLFLRPRGVSVFEDELLIADTRNHRIQVFSLGGEVKRSFGELGDADGQFRLPTACAVSSQGEVFVVDSKHALVKVFGLDGRFIRKFGGLSSSRKERGLLNLPTGICLDGKRNAIYVADTGNNRIQAFDAAGKFLGFIKPPGLELKAPQGLALLESREMAVTDPEADRVWVIQL